MILITYGALWERRNLDMSPTVLHEIGHVMTQRGEINYLPFHRQRRLALMGARVSRNPGQLEALCNCYMFMLCYGSPSSEVQEFGDNPEHIQRDRVAREALRQCPAFSSSMLDDDWRQRFAERP